MILNGDRVFLRSISHDDTNNIIRWRNNPSVLKNLFTSDILTLEQHQNWLQYIVETGKCYQFIICIKETSEPIGTCFLKNIDLSNKKSEFGIFIGEDSARRKGYGTESTQLLLKFGYEYLSLHKVVLFVFSENIGAIESYVRSGFQTVGVLSEDIKKDGSFYDVTIMEYLFTCICMKESGET